MKCARCQSENPPASRFCVACGTPLALACPDCHRLNAPDSKYCGGCGRLLAEGAAAPVPAPSAPEALATGERRQATVMFSDISDYTALTERLDPEVVNEVLSLTRRTAAEVIKKHGGTINQFVGDEVMAVFGIPTAQEDDPARAIKAALELHAEIRTQMHALGVRTGERIAIHTGINTGLILAQYRNDREGLYQLTGEAINTAARLRSLAKADEVLIGPSTHRLIKPYFEVEAQPLVTVKGKSLPIIPY